MDVESEDSLEAKLGSDPDPLTDDSFSIVCGSDYDEASQGSVLGKSNDVIITENDGTANQNGKKSPDIHEIESDNEDEEDCVVTTENKIVANKKIKAVENKKKPELRRSSRTIKRKKYSSDDENDIEEIISDDPLRRKSRPIMINDTKSLVEIAAKQAARSTSAQRREPQLVLIGSNPTAKIAMPNKSVSSSMNATLYHSIVARGTTVTPVPSKQAVSTTYMASQVSQTSQTTSQMPAPAILPSLTDDMFVVEAPSFIVPYVYEKPSIEHFKDFVLNLGKELELQRVKAEKELLEKKKEEKVKLHKERQEKKARGEKVEESEEEVRCKAEEYKMREMEMKGILLLALFYTCSSG